MSKATKATKATTATPAANPMAALIQAVTLAPAAPAAPAKVHSVNANGAVLKAANHVATFKGTKAIPQGGTSYTLTGLPYSPQAGHVNATQWAAVQQALSANGGQATLAQIAEQFTAAGLAAGLAQGFVTYRCKGAKPNLQPVS